MRPLTLFAAPKPFGGEVGVIQRNALRSWGRLDGIAGIVLFGNEEGIGAAAREIGAEHVEQLERNEFGTPRVDWLFREVHERVGFEGLLAYVNADLVLLDDFPTAVASIDFERFLLAGRRRNVRLRYELDFVPGWQDGLRRAAVHRGLQSPWGSDYFVFPAEGTFARVPPFALGRARWDNWMIAKARFEGISVIDGTRSITALHQVHGHEHIPAHTGVDWGGPESDENARLLQSSFPGVRVVFHLWDATHVLGPNGARRTFRPVALWRRLRTRGALARV